MLGVKPRKHSKRPNQNRVRQSAVAIEPGESSFDNPSAANHPPLRIGQVACITVDNSSSL